MSDDGQEWRSIPHANVTRECRDQWDMLRNLISAYIGFAGVEFPSETAIHSAIAAEILDLPHLTAELVRRGQLRQALAGERRCWFPVRGGKYVLEINGLKLRTCGSWGGLEYHHLLPRSHSGTDGPQAPLCGRHHRHVTEHVGGVGWRELAAALGYAEIAAQWEPQR